MAQGGLCLILPHPGDWLACGPGENPAVHPSLVCCSGRPRCWMLWDELSPNLLQTSGKPGTTAVAALYCSALLDVWPGGGCMPRGGSRG